MGNSGHQAGVYANAPMAIPDSRPAPEHGMLAARAPVDVPNSSDNEAQFIKRLQAHDERAFNELVEIYGSRVYGLIYRIMGRHDEAEDLTQEVFVKVFKVVGNFRGDAKLSTWLYRVAVNYCKNRTMYLARRHGEYQTQLEPMEARFPLARAKGVTQGELERPDHLAEGHQVERIVQEALSTMEAEFREALVLRDVENLAYEEISEITGVPEGTVKSRIHRGRSILKAKVERVLGEKVP